MLKAAFVTALVLALTATVTKGEVVDVFGGGKQGVDGKNVRALEFDGGTLTALPGATFDFGATVRSVAVTPDSRYVFAGGEGSVVDGNELRMLAFDGSVLASLPAATFDHGNTVRCVAVAGDGQYVFVGGEGGSGGYELRALGFDGNAFTLLASYDHGAALHGVAVSPDGQYVCIGGEGSVVDGNELRMLAFDGSVLASLPAAVFDHGASVYSVAWSPDGKYVFMSGGEGTGGYEIRALAFEAVSTTFAEVGAFDCGPNTIVYAVATPEPATLSLLALGGLGAVVRRRRG